MSFRRKTYDGSLVRRGIGNTEWRNTFNNKIPIDELTSAKRPRRANDRLALDDDFQAEASHDRYLITYADLITLLLGLFIILYAISNVDLAKYEKMTSALGSYFNTETNINNMKITDPIIEAVRDPIKSLKYSIQNIIEEYGYFDNIRLIENERGITIRIMDNILFESGNAVLTEDSKIILSKLAQVLNTIPNDIRIEGHTDNVPINSVEFPSNWHLSIARATNTAYYIMEERGLAQERVSVVGYAEYKPIAPNDNESGRSLNRRVDIVILKK